MSYSNKVEANRQQIMSGVGMDYNSGRDELIIPEYGRNVQKMIQYARTIEDKTYRQAFVEKIVELMMQMHPQNKNLEDYRDKMWKHVFRIANFDLDVLPPGGKAPKPEDNLKRPEPLNYPDFQPKFRHYGRNVQVLIKKAVGMEPGPIRDGFIGVIGAYMKLAYRTWNREHYISDSVIKDDLETLSGGKLMLDGDMNIDNLSQSPKLQRKKQQRTQGPGGHQGNGNGRHQNNKGKQRRRK